MDSTHLLTRISQRQATLAQQGLLRQRQFRTAVPGQPAKISQAQAELVNFASNDYLGLSFAPEVADALYQGAQQYGAGSTASPLVSGYSDAHYQLEQALATACNAEASLLFSSGFAANTALLKTLFAAQDLVLADKLIHASMIDGLRDAQVKLKRFPHNDVTAAARMFESAVPLALVTESVFSMDGDEAPLLTLQQLCAEHNCPLIVDDAHGFLLTDNVPIVPFARVVTFGKTLGCQGAAIIGSQQLIDFLVANSREYIYSTALSPACCTATLAALHIAQTGAPQQRLKQNIALFRQLAEAAGLTLMPSATAIQPLVVGDCERVLRIAQQLSCKGFLIGAIRPPTVPQGSARLRITLSASHTAEHIQQLVAAITEVLDVNA
ncbi:8-amino-7-oxononanoate synthase [Shewanella avicenniae]|uniref:8-amino-7-oxononanoate synthase n=1 Tax=Shewanella avicenniae TaxID=2814294 RepID=A0ABX7QNT5_9GAMM|nr:8-amino-7-oxononanoate synthase [Shewanella avicenniae]QSX32376.1 8-amino-7-oxononanoate synthase [Shewanella avicenniae]